MTSDNTGPYTYNVSVECARAHINERTANLLLKGVIPYLLVRSTHVAERRVKPLSQ